MYLRSCISKNRAHPVRRVVETCGQARFCKQVSISDCVKPPKTFEPQADHVADWVEKPTSHGRSRLPCHLSVPKVFQGVRNHLNSLYQAWTEQNHSQRLPLRCLAACCNHPQSHRMDIHFLAPDSTCIGQGNLHRKVLLELRWLDITERGPFLSTVSNEHTQR